MHVEKDCWNRLATPDCISESLSHLFLQIELRTLLLILFPTDFLIEPAPLALYLQLPEIQLQK